MVIAEKKEIKVKYLTSERKLTFYYNLNEPLISFNQCTTQL